jgi:hypothetical protein
MDVTFEDNGEKHNRWPLLAELDDEQKEVDATLKRFVGVFCQKSNITKYKQLDKDTGNISILFMLTFSESFTRVEKVGRIQTIQNGRKEILTKYC